VGPLFQLSKASPDSPPAVQLNPAYVEVLRSWSGGIPIVSMINGNEHALTMLNQWPPYDFLDEEVPSVESGVPIIDEVFIDEHVEPWVSAVFNQLLVVKRLAPNPLAHVLPPPPRENPQNSPHFELLRDVISTYGFAPAQLRMKWYKRYCRRLALRLATIDCDVVLPSPEACNAEGLLREEYAEGLTHGNNEYGKLAARQIESWLSRRHA